MNILQDKLLVINKNWQSVNICTLRRALILIFKNDAYFVDENYQLHDWDSWSELGSGELSGVNRSYRVPTIVMVKSGKIPIFKARFTRVGVFRRDQYKCQYCGKNLSRSQVTMDHILPSSRGGKNDWFNCVTSCIKCNNMKSDYTPEESGMKLINQPFKPNYILFDKPYPKEWDNFLNK